MTKKRSKNKRQIDWLKLAVPHLMAVAAAVLIAGTMSVAFYIAN